jgi:heme A synthase
MQDAAQIGLAPAMVGLVNLQGLFGKWTVTLLLTALVMLNFAAYSPSSLR